MSYVNTRSRVNETSSEILALLRLLDISSKMIKEMLLN